MKPHSLNNFEVQTCYHDDCVYSKNNLIKLKNETYVINIDEYKSIETHWIALYFNGDNTMTFACFGVEYITT